MPEACPALLDPFAGGGYVPPAVEGAREGRARKGFGAESQKSVGFGAPAFEALTT